MLNCGFLLNVRKPIVIIEYIELGESYNVCVGVLWPQGTHHERVHILVTDGAAYMGKAAKALRVFYPNMIHIRCVAHSLHNVSEVIRTRASLANALVVAVKKVFRKSPIRIAEYNEVCPDLPLPPKPVSTRWGTWIKSVCFIARNFERIKQVVDRLDPQEALAIKDAQELFSNPAARTQVAYVTANFANIPTIITALEERGLSLSDALRLFDQASDVIEAAEGEIAVAAKDKLRAVTEKNVALPVLRAIRAVATGEATHCPIEPGMVAGFRYAPLVSVEVERSFSVYKSVLAENRQSLTPANIQAILVTRCNMAKE